MTEIKVKCNKCKHLMVVKLHIVDKLREEIKNLKIKLTALEVMKNNKETNSDFFDDLFKDVIRK